MVRQNSKKTSKYTYAERVLDAYSAASKEHRRHSIHMATLRAQVRKTAQSRKDKLGPQWSNWVGRAVHKLEDEGIFEHAQASGSVTMTPTGKKAVTAAQRSLRLAKNSPPTAMQEEMIWKTITHQFTGGGLKRKQSTTYGEDDHDEEQAEVLSTLNHGRAKKPRTSLRTGTGKKPISKMTKAELNAELKSLQRAHATDTQASTHDAEMDEALELLDQLQQRQDEINSLREELTKAKYAMTDMTDIQHDGVTGRPATRGFIDNHLTRRNPDDVVPGTRALLGVTRTQSGSFISQISKHPTPAPSSPGSDHHSHDVSFDEDFFVGGNDHDPSTFLATPTSSPVRAHAGSKDVEFSTEVEKYKALVGQLTMIGNVSQEKIQTLERTLASRTLELQAFEQQVAKSETGSSVQAERDARISFLQRQVEDIQKRTSAQDAVIASKDIQISGLEAAKAGLEESMDVRHVEHENAVREREESIHDLMNEKQSLADELANLQKTLSEAQSRLQSAYDHEVSLQTSIDTIRARLDEEQSSNAGLREERMELQDEIRTLREASSSEVETLWRKVSELQETIQGLQATTVAEVTQTSIRNAALSRELATLQDCNDSLSQQLTEARAKQAQVERDMADAHSSAVESLNDRIMAMQKELEDSRTVEANLNVLLSQTQHDEQAVRSQVASLEAQVVSLDGQLEASTHTVEELRTELRANSAHSQAQELTLAAKEQAIADLEIVKDEATSKIFWLSEENKKTAQRFSELEEVLKSTEVALDQSSKNAERITQDLAAKERKQEDLVKKLESAESAMKDLEDKGADRLEDIKTLLSELETVKHSAEGHRVAFDDANKQRAADAISYQTSVSALQNSVSASQAEVVNTRAELDALNLAHSSTKSALEDARAGFMGAQACLDAERVRVSTLERDLLDAVRRAKEAEEEVADLKQSREQDEEGLKAAFESLRQVQMASLVEFDNKIVSAHSSPMPDRRRSRMHSNV